MSTGDIVKAEITLYSTLRNHLNHRPTLGKPFEIDIDQGEKISWSETPSYSMVGA